MIAPQAAPTATTRLAGVVGWPVGHSLSPVVHNAAFAHAGLDWVYVALPLLPDGAVETLRATWALGVSGLSVTMPHKRAARDAAVERSGLVETTGAANTLVRLDHGWMAENTDVTGFVSFLERDLGFSCDGMSVGILGAGGAAGAVATGVQRAGAASVSVWNRTAIKAADLVASLPTGMARVAAVPSELSDADLLVSCVPVEAVPDELACGPGQVVVDLVYHPPVTPLMERARAAGATAHNGLGLLVHQAGEQFRLWTGHDAPVDVMARAAREALEGRG